MEDVAKKVVPVEARYAAVPAVASSVSAAKAGPQIRPAARVWLRVNAPPAGSEIRSARSFRAVTPPASLIADVVR
jgi:hypothetical protein